MKGTICFVIFSCILVISASAQNIAINTSGSAADPTAILDVAATNKGMLLPRVTLTGTSDVATISGTEATGLLVYNTASVSDVTPGFYYWNGSVWVRLITTSGGGGGGDGPCYTCEGF